jgi:hypothetical protein
MQIKIELLQNTFSDFYAIGYHRISSMLYKIESSYESLRKDMDVNEHDRLSNIIGVVHIYPAIGLFFVIINGLK